MMTEELSHNRQKIDKTQEKGTGKNKMKTERSISLILNVNENKITNYSRKIGKSLFIWRCGPLNMETFN